MLCSVSHEFDAIVKEFVPSQPRRCRALCWNPVLHHLVRALRRGRACTVCHVFLTITSVAYQFAVGLDKLRSDPCLVVWDASVKGKRDRATIARCSRVMTFFVCAGTRPTGAGTSTSSVPINRHPISAFLTADGVSALAWLPGGGNALSV
jgi:hypothetical protein